MSIFPIRRDEAICFGLGKSFVDSWPPECEADIPIGLFMNSHLITQEWLNERLAREPIILKIDGQIILITELTVQEFFNLELEIFCRANVLKTAASSNSKKKDIAYETTFRGRITTLYQRFLAGQPLTNKDFCQDALLKEEGLIVRTMAHLMQISLANHDNRQLIIRTWPLTEIKRVRGTVSDPGKGAFAKHLLSSSMLSYRIFRAYSQGSYSSIDFAALRRRGCLPQECVSRSESPDSAKAERVCAQFDAHSSWSSFEWYSQRFDCLIESSVISEKVMIINLQSNVSSQTSVELV